MRLAEFDYPLPPELIAQEPAPERDGARLLVAERARPTRHASVRDLPAVLRAGDVLVVNDTRVIAARVRGRRPTGGRLELLFVRPLAGGTWEVLVRGGPRPGESVHLPDATGTWTVSRGDGLWELAIETREPVVDWLERVGEVPLPPYIRRPDGPTAQDRARYQTVYAREKGSVAAPTAGLHFTPALLERLQARGIERAEVVLHVGPGTFRPVQVDDVRAHTVPPEPYQLPVETADAVQRARQRQGRVVAVGTTTTRVLETRAAAARAVTAGEGQTSLVVVPGFSFGVVDALVTNFHLPRSSLLLLVAAFAGRERILAAYAEAVGHRYRFYSYGDAMLIL